MKHPWLFSFIVLVLLAGCSATPTIAPPVPAATPTAALPAAATFQATAPAATVAPTMAATRPPPVKPSLTGPTVLQRIALLPLPGAGRAPAALAQLGATLYVANANSDNIAVIRDRRVQALIPTARSPNTLAADSAHARLYVGTYISPTLALIQNDAVVRTLSLSESVASLAYTPDKLLVGLGSAPVVQARDPATLEKKGEVKLSAGFDVMQLIVDAPRHRVYAGTYARIVILDLDSLQEIGSFPAPQFYGSLAVNPGDGTIWAGIYDDQQHRGGVAVFNPSGQELRRVLADDDLRSSDFDAAGRLWVPSSFSDRVDVIEGASGQVIANIPVGLSPYAVLVDDANHVVYVANWDSDSISVVDMQALKVTATIPVGMKVTALAVNEARGRVYAANASTDSVFVVENGRIVREVPVGHHPIDLARDPKTGRLFVANSVDGAVSVVDEDSLVVQSSLPVTTTRALTSLDVDAANRRLFAGSTVFNLDTLTLQGNYEAQGANPGTLLSAAVVRADPARGQFYTLASNGIPGSNGRMVLYRFSEGGLGQLSVLSSRNRGSVTAFLVDPASGRVYAGLTHPMAFYSALGVWDADGNEVSELSVTARTSGLALNPGTNHLFLAHNTTYCPCVGQTPPRDNTVQILDIRTLGEVGLLDVPGGPGPMARIGDTIYVAGDDGMLTLIGDAQTAAPPAPTLTPTSTPYPTSPPTLAAPTVRAATATRTPPPVAVLCTYGPGAPFSTLGKGLEARLGCADGQSQLTTFAYQPFSQGQMFDDLHDPGNQVIYGWTLPGRTYFRFPDTWQAGMPEDACPELPKPFAAIKRGFNKVWCEHPEVRTRIGVPQAGESGITLNVQRYQHGMIWANDAGLPPAVLFDDGSFLLYANGQWQ
ncbi:MAG: hypothetical protein WCF84_20375 [Anaerolineae bacterium]